MSKRKYTREFKLSAVKLVNEQGYSIADAGKSLGVDPNNIRNWVEKFSGDQDLPPSGQGRVEARQNVLGQRLFYIFIRR